MMWPISSTYIILRRIQGAFHRRGGLLPFFLPFELRVRVLQGVWRRCFLFCIFQRVFVIVLLEAERQRVKTPHTHPHSLT